jgi:hypothetical protein
MALAMGLDPRKDPAAINKLKQVFRKPVDDQNQQEEQQNTTDPDNEVITAQQHQQQQSSLTIDNKTTAAAVNRRRSAQPAPLEINSMTIPGMMMTAPKVLARRASLNVKLPLKNNNGSTSPTRPSGNSPTSSPHNSPKLTQTQPLSPSPTVPLEMAHSPSRTASSISPASPIVASLISPRMIPNTNSTRTSFPARATPRHGSPVGSPEKIVGNEDELSAYQNETQVCPSLLPSNIGIVHCL